MTIQDPGRYMVKQMIDAAMGDLVDQFDAVPTEGSTVTSPAATRNLGVQLNGATDLNEVALVLPPAAPVGLRVFIRTENAIGALQVTAEPGVAVDNWTVNLAPKDCVVFYHGSVNIWSRIS